MQSMELTDAMNVVDAGSRRRRTVRAGRAGSVSFAAALLAVLLVPSAGASEEEAAASRPRFTSVDEPWRDRLEAGQTVSMYGNGEKNIHIDARTSTNPRVNRAAVGRLKSSATDPAVARLTGWTPQALPPDLPNPEEWTPYAGGVAAGTGDLFPSDGEIFAGGWRPFFKAVRTTTIAPSSVIAAALDEKDGVVSIHLVKQGVTGDAGKAVVWLDDQPATNARIGLNEFVVLERAQAESGEIAWNFVLDGNGQIKVFTADDRKYGKRAERFDRYDLDKFDRTDQP